MSGKDAFDPIAGPTAGEAWPAPLHVGYRRGSVRRLFRNRPLLTLDADGVTLHSTRVSLLWADVAEVRVVTRPDGVRTVVFVADDPDLALGRLQGLAFWFAVHGIDRVGGPVFVRAHDLAIELEPLLTAIHRFAAVPIKQRYTP